ncbi:MAG: hypothetical protein AB7U73_01705, partial [Pirellulales bacterium]
RKLDRFRSGLPKSHPYVNRTVFVPDEVAIGVVKQRESGARWSDLRNGFLREFGRCPLVNAIPWRASRDDKGDSTADTNPASHIVVYHLSKILEPPRPIPNIVGDSRGPDNSQGDSYGLANSSNPSHAAIVLAAVVRDLMDRIGYDLLLPP